LGPTSRRASAYLNLHVWCAQPAPLRCPVAQLLIQPKSGRRFSKISSWIWSKISGVVTVLDLPGWGASQMEKSPRLNWHISLRNIFLSYLYVQQWVTERYTNISTTNFQSKAALIIEYKLR
jgi:hypothetical protein